MFLESLLHEQYSLGLVLFASFAAGMLASFTPCIYPMIPVTVGIITAQRTSSMLMNFFLSLTYGLGIASVYAMLGYLSATGNLMFGQWLGHPLFIFAMVGLFAYLAFAMFGFYEMYTPAFLRAHSTSNYRGGSLTYSYVFGLLTGAAASPCLTPALALLLSFASTQENPLVGFAVLFAFAMGLSMILIVVGTFSSALDQLPRAGSWMNEVKTIFGFALLGVCISFTEPLSDSYSVAYLYGLLSCVAAAYYARRSRTTSSFAIPFIALSALLFVVAILFFMESDPPFFARIADLFAVASPSLVIKRY